MRTSSSSRAGFDNKLNYVSDAREAAKQVKWANSGDSAFGSYDSYVGSDLGEAGDEWAVAGAKSGRGMKGARGH